MKRQSGWLAWALVVATLAYMVGVAVGGYGAVVPTPPGFDGYATATALHVDAIQSGTTRLVDTELAFSAGATDSDGFGAASIQNEMQVTIQPNSPTATPPVVFTGKNSSGRGSGLEIGVNNGVPSAARTTLAQNIAEAVAPPSTALVTKQTGPVNVSPAAYASLLRGQALANWGEDPCSFGPQTPLAYGLGYIVDAQLVNAGGPTTETPPRFAAPVVATDALDPDRSVTQSRSFTYAKPNGDGTYGLVSETRTTFAPITIDRGTPLPTPDVVIEILGEWIFRATATGKPGGAVIDQTVELPTGEDVTPTTTVIRISTNGGATFTDITFQEIFTSTGFVIPAAMAAVIAGAIGEDARAIAKPVAPATVPIPDPLSQPTEEADGTLASGAADVIRLQLVNAVPGGHVADLRIGHQEAVASVPEGGFECTSEPTTTTTGDPTTSTSTSSTSSTTSTTQAPTTTTTQGPTTTTTAPPATTAAPPATTAPPTTAPPAQPPPPAPPAKPVVVSPSFVG